MFLYLSLGSNDLARSKRFYDAALAPLGIVRRTDDNFELGYAPPRASRVHLWISNPFDGARATHGNGTMVCFDAQSRAAVDAFYKAALDHGGSDEGKPGLRPYGPHFYAAYVRDPDGNKLSAVCETQSF